MKKAEREPYLLLTRIELPSPFNGNMGLCHFCGYAEWSGSCDESDLECHHPLWQVPEQADGAWDGTDCWGFRPCYSREDCVDMVGIHLQGLVPDLDSVPVSWQCKALRRK